jgi:cytochrome c biogenesis protein ResB
MVPHPERAKRVEGLLALLSSIRFARGLLIAIGSAALAGSLIPQQEPPATYLARFGPSGAWWLARLGLTDLYHSWYFIGLLVLLGASLLVCSIRRLAASLKTVGSILTHMSLVLILVGGAIKHLAGLEGVVELREGDQTNQLKVTETRTTVLPFTVLLEDFSLERYVANPQTVSEFVSRVRLVENGLGTRALVRVNHPITYRGFRIYQLGYNQDDPTWSALLLLKDPGVGVVYSGFGMLLVGLITTFYLAPLSARPHTV